MKKFVNHIIKIVFIIIIAIITIGEIKISDEKVIKLVPVDYSKVIWNLDLINKRPNLINGSVVFIGSSLIDQGISDSLLCAKGIKSINMGVSRAGFDLDYYFVRRILKFKPRMIYLIRMPNGSSQSHPVTPLLMSPISHLVTFKQFNLNFIRSYIPKRILFVIKSILISDSKMAEKTSKLYGQTYLKNQYLKLDNSQLDKFIYESKKKLEKINHDSIDNNGIHISKSIIGNIWRYFIAYFIYGNGEKIRNQTHKLCQAHNVLSREIYIPCYADAILNKEMRQSFQRNFVLNSQLDCLYIKDMEFLNNSKYWRDINHLSYKGSLVFTDSLYTYINQ